ncbi:MAG TPA: nuclear transport factor 2 family protein [Anaeromyxobacteraceae bacterium]
MPRSGSRGEAPAPPRTSTGDLARIGVRSRKERGGHSGAPYLVPAGLALAAVLVAWLSWGRLVSCGASLETPETQIRRALTAQQRAHLDQVYGFHAGGTVELYQTRYEDVVPLVERGRATVVAMLTAEGRVAWRDQEAKLAYIGRERFHMKPCSIARWCGEGDQFERLRALLLALFRRQDALEQGDVSRARVKAWQIRVERDAAEVGEDLEVTPPGGPARAERRLLRLVWRDERWVFAGGM